MHNMSATLHSALI